jgi:hypothetical protein
VSGRLASMNANLSGRVLEGGPRTQVCREQVGMGVLQREWKGIVVGEERAFSNRKGKRKKDRWEARI